MIQTKKKPYRTDILFFIIVSFLAASLSGYGQITNYISAGLLLFIIPNCLNLIPQKMLTGFMSLVVFILFFILTSIPNYNSLYYLFGTCIMYTLVTFGPYFIKVYIERVNNPAQKEKLFKYSALIWFLIVVVSIVTYYASENGGRDFASEHKGSFLGGGYGAAYASALMATVCFNYLLAGKRKVSKKAKALLLLGLILSGVHVFYTMSTITIVAMVLGCVLSFFFHGLKTNKLSLRAIIFSFLLIAISVYFLVNIEDMGLRMIKASYRIENELLSERLSEVGRFLYANDESHHMGNRLYTLRISWQTFTEQPIFGMGYKYGNTYDLLSQNGVGVHSELLDSLAKYGIAGSIPYLYFFYTQVKSLIEKSLYRITVPFIAAFLIMFVFNPFLSVQTVFMICLYLPLLIELVEKEKQNGNDLEYED